MRAWPISLVLCACSSGSPLGPNGAGDLGDPPPHGDATSWVVDAAETDADPVDAEVPDHGAAPDLGAAERPAYCPPAAAGLQDVVGTPAAPYLVHHPGASGAEATVVFLPGADGSRMISTQFIWPRWLANGSGVDRVRVVVPYTNDGDLLDEGQRVAAVAAEVVACFGGDPGRVHLAGTSNGGLAAFGTMLQHPGSFASLLGAPGAFERAPSDAALIAAFTGKAIFLAVGAEDSNRWRAAAENLHQRMLALGVRSEHLELVGEGHILSEGFDSTAFYNFWLAEE
jgi:predicted esterase